MTTATNLRVLCPTALVCVLLSCACASKGDKDTNGLDHPENVPWVVALAKPALTCGWFELGFDSCDAESKFRADKRWTKKLAPSVRATLVRMLADKRFRVRALASIALRDNVRKVAHDATVADAVMTALEKETVPGVAWPLSLYIGRTDLKAAGLTDRAKKVMRSHQLPGVREQLLNLVGRSRNKHLLAFVIQVARDPSIDESHRLFAAQRLPPTKQVCALWLELVAEPGQRLSSRAARWMASSARCGGIEDLTTAIERRAARAPLEQDGYCEALARLLKHPRATEAQRKRALSLALDIARSSKHAELTRAICLAAVSHHHPDGAAISKKLLAANSGLARGFRRSRDDAYMKRAHERYPWPGGPGSVETLAANDPARGPLVSEVVVPSDRGMRISHHAHCEAAEHGLVCSKRRPQKPTGWKLAKAKRTLVATEYRRGGVQRIVVVTSNRAGAVTQITRLSASKTVVSAQVFRVPGKRYTHRARTGSNVLDQCGAMELAADARGRARRVVCLGWDGKPRTDGQGVMESRVTRDASGFETGRAFFDADKQPVERRDGVHRLAIVRDKQGRVVERAAFGRDGTPTLTSGCHRTLYAWADDGTLQSKKCVDRTGKPVPGLRNVTEFRFEYSAAGCQTKVAHFDSAGSPALDIRGVHARQFEVDEYCRETHSWCTDIEGKPSSCGGGENPNMRFTYDAHDNVTETRFYDPQGKPSKSVENSTFATKQSFDENGRPVRFSCFDAMSKKVDCGTAGYHAKLFEWDTANRVVRTSFEDADGNPTTNIDAAFQRFRYDSYDRNIEFISYDRDGNRASSLGSASTRYLFDQRGRQFAILMQDKNGNPAAFGGCLIGLSCPAKRAWHALRVEWSPRGHVLYNYFFDRYLQLIERIDCSSKQCFD